MSLIFLQTMLVRCKKESRKGSLNLCFIVVVLVIVSVIIFGAMYETGFFLFVCFNFVA